MPDELAVKGMSLLKAAVTVALFTWSESDACDLVIQSSCSSDKHNWISALSKSSHCAHASSCHLET